MSIAVRLATKADIPAMARISHYAFVDHLWTRAMYPVQDAQGNIARYQMRHENAWDSNTWFVAVEGAAEDPQSLVVGYAKWTIYPKQRAENEWNTPYEPVAVPEGGRQDAADIPGKVLHEMRMRNYKGDPHVLLHFLVVDPAHQRRGIGGKLLQWGMAKSDQLGVPSFMESTAEGEGLYYKNGWRTVDEMIVDTTQWGLEGPIHLKCMRREPAGKPRT